MKADNITLSIGTEVIYDDASFQVNDGDKVGVVGVNGAGKTTLFNVILGKRQLDEGTLNLGSSRMGYLPQEVKFKNLDKTVFEYLCDIRPIEALNRELEELYEKVAVAEPREQKKMLRRIGDIQEELDCLDCYNADKILFDVIEEMGLDDEILSAKLNTLSGGQKSKIAFAGILYLAPTVLLLDEPTNHLDRETKDFVIDYLKRYSGTMLVISHDVDFLNAVTNKTMYINKSTHKIKVYNGNYSKFKKQLCEEQKAKEQRIIQQEREIKKLEDFVLKASQASRTNHNLKRMGQDREIKLQKAKANLEKRDRLYKRVKMNIAPKREGSKMPLSVDKLNFKYEGKEDLYHNLSFSLTSNEKFLIVGENGVGKSTLLKLLMGILHSRSGTISFGLKTDISYYAQELELLDEDMTIFDNVSNELFTDIQIRNVLGNFLFYGDTVFKKVKYLSPGEKSRVALCKILLERANLLILDEPTNHLDVDTQAVIGENFREFQGTILLVSHNTSFVEQLGITRMLILPEGKIVDYSRELLDYYSLVNTL